MKQKISLVMITKNMAKILGKSLSSVNGVVDEIVIVDDYSVDSTRTLAKKFKAKVYLRHFDSFYRQKKYAIERTKNHWVLLLDSDEILSPGLKKEIKQTFNKKNIDYDGFFIPYQNHFLGKPVHWGGEDYQMIRLFRKDRVFIKPVIIHEKIEAEGKRIGYFKNKIFHYSYRSLWQVYKKFTWYATLEAKLKQKTGEKTSLKKIILYPLHMFYSRFIEDKGYKDGWWRIPLDLGFAYMEFLTYFLLLITWSISNKKKK